MDILIIGNGFDIAHGLPTTYTEFLKYCRDYVSVGPVSSDEAIVKEFNDFRNENIWLKYFLASTPNLDDSRTWINFEQEIADVLKSFDQTGTCVKRVRTREHPPNNEEMRVALNPDSFDSKILSFLPVFCDPITRSYSFEGNQYIISNKEIANTNDLIDFMFRHLQQFARAFEIYCLHINERNPEIVASFERKKQIEELDEKIKNIGEALIPFSRKQRTTQEDELRKQERKATEKWSSLNEQKKPIDYLGMSKFDCVLSFNYTNTYKKLYENPNSHPKTKYCYIHGKAQGDSQKTNIIFGFFDEKESEDFQWIRFKKYYQRIINKTGSEYKNWLPSVKKDALLIPPVNTVHVVGHSLDTTDFDVLYEVFTNKTCKIIIYYYKQEDFDNKVQQVIKLLAHKGGNGRDELISRVHGEDWTIKFVDQYDPVEGLFIKRPKAINNAADGEEKTPAHAGV